MKKNPSAHQWFGLVAAVSAVTFVLSGCSGSDGSAGPPGPPGTNVGVVSVTTATALNMTVTSATVNSAPVVNFTVTDQNGIPVVGLTDTDLRFNIAKLTPGTDGNPDTWQNYIIRASSGAMQGSQERKSSGYPFGTLVDNKNGTYTYTFCTDITNNTGTPDFTKCSAAPQPNICATPCTDTNGNALDISYQPTLTTRVGIQQANSAYPKSNATFDFVPAGGAVTTERIIVQTANCNQCHNQLTAHGSRIDTKLCVTCHNPGSWVAAGSSGSVTWVKETVDFKHMIHKIHRGENLPSVVAGTPYTIRSSDFSDVAFPQDIRNCTKCHNNSDLVATPQGDNWESRPSIAACGSCHDDVYFGAAPDPTKPYQTVAHPGGDVSNVDSSTCLLCHKTGGPGLSIAAAHTIQSKVARGKFKFNIVAICGTAVASKPLCAPGTVPTVKFSVTDPTGGTHGYPNSTYNLFSDPEFWDSVNNKALASLNVDIAWDTRDYNNAGGYAARPARANQINVYGTTSSSSNYGNASIAAYAPAVSNGDGTYTVTALGPIPDGTVWPNVAASGSGVVAIEGRAYNPITDTGLTGSAANRTPIKGEVAYFRITDASPVARRVATDAQLKCDNCHDQLSLHGGNRNDNVQLCVICHNPNNTDAQASFRTKYPNGLTQVNALDGKKEEAIDIKRMIHGIHAGAQKSLDGTKTLSGFRTKGLVVSGTDFSDVRFPGILNDCTTCHTGTTYQLTGIWDSPTQNGILGSTIDSTPGLTSANTSTEVNNSLQDPADDLNISPTAAVCSSCHDDTNAQNHMISSGLAQFSATQTNIINGNAELCSICHGPGSTADVKVVHGVK